MARLLEAERGAEVFNGGRGEDATSGTGSGPREEAEAPEGETEAADKRLNNRDCC